MATEARIDGTRAATGLVPNSANERLKASGIERIVLGAGDLDGARPIMQEAARRLDTSGIQVRYISLGAFGHCLPHDVGETLREALAWAREG